jgi:hypothetical protein
LINVNRDLLGAAPGGDMLGACQRRPATVASKPEEIFRDQRYRAPRASLPRRVRRRIDDNLTHDSPTTVVRIAARNEEPRQRLGYPHSSGLGPVTIQVPQCGTNVPAPLNRPGELPGSPPRLCFVHHRSLFTVLHRKAALHAGLLQRASITARSVTEPPRAGAEADSAARRRADWTRAVADRREGWDVRISRKRSPNVPDPATLSVTCHRRPERVNVGAIVRASRRSRAHASRNDRAIAGAYDPLVASGSPIANCPLWLDESGIRGRIRRRRYT